MSLRSAAETISTPRFIREMYDKNMPMGSKWGIYIHGICQLSQIFRPNFANINRNKDNPWYNPFTQLPAAAPWLLSGNASVAAANCSRLQPEDQEVGQPLQ